MVRELSAGGGGVSLDITPLTVAKMLNLALRGAARWKDQRGRLCWCDESPCDAVLHTGPLGAPSDPCCVTARAALAAYDALVD